MAYECHDCGNESEFSRIITIRESFTKSETGEWSGDHASEELLDVKEVECCQCGAIVY